MAGFVRRAIRAANVPLAEGAVGTAAAGSSTDGNSIRALIQVGLLLALVTCLYNT